jgi:hypothetical protein
MRRRRDGDHTLWELADGRVVRWVEAGRHTLDDHVRDAAGHALVDVHYENGLPVSAAIPAVPAQAIPLLGFVSGPIPTGTMWAPPAGQPLAGGTLTVSAEATDPFAPEFVEGLLAGCGCVLFDRGAAWVDGRVAAHHALLVPDPTALPGAGRPDLVEIWAVPREGTTLLLVWRAAAPEDPVAASAAARLVPALVDLDPAEEAE